MALAAVSEAWRVLGDPVSRAEYDDSLISRSTSRREIYPEHEVVNDVFEESDFVAPQIFARAQFPWRFMLTLIAVGAIVVLLLRTVDSPNISDGPDSLIQSGSCVMIDPTQAVYEVSCDGPHDGVVRQLIGFDLTCSSDTFGYRDRQGMGIACLEP